MTWFLGFLAIGCVIYYGIIVAYSGFATSFSFVWLVLAGVNTKNLLRTISEKPE